jgi:hypothetical protein
MEDISRINTSSSSNSNSTMQQQPGQSHAALREFDLSHLTAEDWLNHLHRVLPQASQQQQPVNQTPAAVQRQQQDAVDRCSMADLLWRLLQEKLPASEAAVRQLLEESCSWQLLGFGLRVLVQHGLSRFTEEEWVQGRQGPPAGMADAAAAAQQQQQWKRAYDPFVAATGHLDAVDASLQAELRIIATGQLDAAAEATPYLEYNRVPDAVVALSEAVHAERLLWLQQRGLLYGTSCQELLLHTLLAQAGVAAARGQTSLAAQYLTKTRSLALAGRGSAAAAVDPVELQQKQATKAASLVFHGRVVAACQAGAFEQLQQLEQLQHLTRVLARLASTQQPEYNIAPFSTVHMFSEAPAGIAAGCVSAATAADVLPTGLLEQQQMLVVLSPFQLS